MLRARLRELKKAGATALRGMRHGTDARWVSDHAYHAEWDERVALMTRMIPDGTTVIDLGAGQMAARRLLPSGCRYIPVDMVARDETTVVCDINRGALPELEGDWVLMSGVLEYLSDVPGVLRWARRTAPNLSVSFVVRESGYSYRQRLALGWVQHLRRGELLEQVTAAGFDVVEETSCLGQVLLTAAARG